MSSPPDTSRMEEWFQQYEPTPQQAPTLPRREGGREGSRKVCLLDAAFLKRRLPRPTSPLSTTAPPSRLGRVAACCGVGSYGRLGVVPKLPGCYSPVIPTIAKMTTQ